MSIPGRARPLYRQRLQEHQALHGRNDVEKLRAAVFLLRVCLPVIFDLASGRSPRSGGSDGRIWTLSDCDSAEYARVVAEADRRRIDPLMEPEATV